MPANATGSPSLPPRQKWCSRGRGRNIHVGTGVSFTWSVGSQRGNPCPCSPATLFLFIETVSPNASSWQNGMIGEQTPVPCVSVSIERSFWAGADRGFSVWGRPFWANVSPVPTWASLFPDLSLMIRHICTDGLASPPVPYCTLETSCAAGAPLLMRLCLSEERKLVSINHKKVFL